MVVALRFRQASSALNEPPPGHGASKGANLVVILIDTLRADRLGCYGFDADTSPEIDRIARNGVRFARTVSQCTWTRPSIGSLITSRYPRSIGIYDERGQILADRYTTLAEVLKEHGYTSLAATANPNTNTAYNFQQGYDQYVDSTVRFDWMNEGIGDEEYDEAPLQSARDVFTALLERVRQLDRPPYHLMATLMEVHEAHDARVDLSAQAKLFEGYTHRRYLQAIRKVSEDIDWFKGELGKLPGWEHTLFAIVSDHGEGLDSHPGIPASRWHGWLAYESHAVVPMILYSTGSELPRGAVVERPVRLLDAVPTLLDLLGIEPRAEMDGVSLRPLLGSGEAAPPIPEDIIVETRLQGVHTMAAYGPDWKYIEHRKPIKGTEPMELQARGGGEDGGRTSKLDSNPDIAARLRDALHAWEARHESVPPTMRGEPIDAAMQKQLKSLGYLGEER